MFVDSARYSHLGTVLYHRLPQFMHNGGLYRRYRACFRLSLVQQEVKARFHGLMLYHVIRVSKWCCMKRVVFFCFVLYLLQNTCTHNCTQLQ